MLIAIVARVKVMNKLLAPVPYGCQGF